MPDFWILEEANNEDGGGKTKNEALMGNSMRIRMNNWM